MSNEQRIQTVKIVWEAGDANERIASFTRTIRGTDAAVEELSRSMGNQGKVTTQLALNQTEANREGRKALAVAQQQKNAYDKLKVTLQTQIRTFNMSDNALERFNAQMRLAQGSTFKQRMEVARMVKALQKQRSAIQQTTTATVVNTSANKAAQKSMRNMRGQAQNLGWQLQDVAVQWQMGTDKMVIFSQQGSQFLGAMGPWGAIAGAVVAVTGALAGVAIKMITGKKSAKELEEAQLRLNKAFKEGSSEVNILNDAYRELWETNRTRALLQAQQGMRAAQVARIAAQDNFDKLVENNWVLLKLRKIRADADQSFASADKAFNDEQIDAKKELMKELQITEEQYNKISKAIENGSMANVSDLLNDITTNTKGATGKLVDFTIAMGEVALESKKGAEAYDIYNSIVKNGTLPTDLEKAAEAAKELAKANVKEWRTMLDNNGARFDRIQLIGKDARATEIYNTTVKATTDALRENLPYALKQVNLIHDKLDAIEALKESQKKQLAFEKLVSKSMEDDANEATKARVIADKQRENAAKTIKRWEEKRLSLRLNARAQAVLSAEMAVTSKAQLAALPATLEAINAHYDVVDAIDAELEAEKRRAAYYANTASGEAVRQKFLQEIEVEQTGPQNQPDIHKDNIIALEHQKQLELAKIEKQGFATSNANRMSYVTELARINGLIANEKERLKLAELKFNADQQQAVLKSMALSAEVMQNTIDMISGGANEIKEQTANMNAFQKTMFLANQVLQATTAWINGIALGGKLAVQFPMAAIPMQAFGTAMGAANAGAIMGATVKGLDKGGKIPSGGNAIVSEVGDELVNGVMVKGPARVTSREETAQMMNKAPQMNINVVNEVGVNTRVEQIDENTVKIIAFQIFNENIDKGVASVVGKAGTKANKSLRGNFNLQKRY